MARLAAASITIQRSDVAFILPHDPCWKCATISFVSKQQLQKEPGLRDQEQQTTNSTCDSDSDTFGQEISETEEADQLYKDAQTSDEQSDDDDARGGLSSYASLPIQEAEGQRFKRNFDDRTKTSC
jgi:hypothetical protein